MSAGLADNSTECDVAKKLTLSTINRGWPHQIALLKALSEGTLADEQALYCNRLLRCSVIPSVTCDGQMFNIHCFATRAGASAFMSKFGGEWFDPAKRGRGEDADPWIRKSVDDHGPG